MKLAATILYFLVIFLYDNIFLSVGFFYLGGRGGGGVKALRQELGLAGLKRVFFFIYSQFDRNTKT